MPDPNKKVVKRAGSPLIQAAKDGSINKVAHHLMEGADIASTDKDGFTALHWASDKGHLEVVVQLLEKGANRDAKNKDGRKPLHLAAHSGHEPVVEKLLETRKDKVEKKTDVDSPDKEGWTPLYCAARHNHHTIVKLLIENHKANLEKTDRDGWTPLHAAAANGQQESAKALLSLGAKWEAKAGDGRTPLYCAARYGYPAVARMLLSQGAIVGAPTKEGWTPLHGAVAKAGNGPVVQVLLEFDANIEATTARGWTPLICAAINGQEAMVRLLLEKDPNFPNFPTAKVNAQSKNGNTALHAACTNKEQNIVSVLIENGADLTLKNDQHETGFYLIARHGFAVLMRQLFENERIDMAAVLDKTDRGRRSLYTAIHWGYGDIALLLLQNGANPGSSDLDENTELHWAAHFGLMEVITELLKIEEGKIKEKNRAGGKAEEAMIDKQNKFGQTATHRAIEMDHEEVALLLLEREATKEATKEATVDIADKKGNTKLHLAANQGQKKVVSRLLEMGANVTEKNKEGETAMHLAARKRHQEVVVILLKSIVKIVEGPTTEWNAMQWAIYYGDPELVRLLVLHVPEVYAKDGRRQSAADLARNLLDVARKRESQPAEMERRDTILERREAVLDWIEAIPTDPKIPELTPLEKPTDDMRQVCDTSLVYMMDFYSQEQRFYSVEKFRYTVSDVVYDRGPENLMSPAAKHRISPLKPDDLLFRWIHLPANNRNWVEHLIQSIYYHKTQEPNEAAHMKAEELFHPNNFLSEIRREYIQEPNEAAHMKAEELFHLNNFLSESRREHTGEAHARFMEPSFRFYYADTARKGAKSPAGPKRKSTEDGNSGKSEFEQEKKGASGSGDEGERPRSPLGANRTMSIRPGADGRPKEQEIARAPLTDVNTRGLTNPGELRIALYMPYLRFGTLKGLRAMQRAIKDAHRKSTQHSGEKGKDNDRPKKEMQESAKYEDGNESGNDSKQRRVASDSQTKVEDKKIKPEEVDQEKIQTDNRNLILAYLHHDDCLHVSRTLDQFYYHSLSPEKLEDRNTDQVVFKYAKKVMKLRNQHPVLESYQICMVDQLWLWVIDEKTIITSFPRGWDEDEHGALRTLIRKHILDDRRPRFSSVYEMAALITSLCIGFALNVKLSHCAERLLPIFSATIAKATNSEVDFFDDFKKSLNESGSMANQGQSASVWRDESKMGELSGKRNQPKKEGRAEKKERKEQEKEERKAKRENRNIRREMILLEEIKDILDELNMIRIVLEEQRAVWEKLTGLIAGVGGAGSGGSDGKDATLSGGAKNSRFLTYYNDMTNLDTSTREVAKMIEDARATQDSINHLLELRQKHANLSEAAWARQSSEDTTKQGRTILVFTVVTIIFLPMSFLTSFFALNVTNFPHSSGNLLYSPEWAFSRIFGITAAISLPLIAIAVFVNQVMDLCGALFFDEDPTRDFLDDTWGLRSGKWIRDLVKSVWKKLTGQGIGDGGNKNGNENRRGGGGGDDGSDLGSEDTGELKARKGPAIHPVLQHPNRNLDPIGGLGGVATTPTAAAAQRQPPPSHVYTAQHQAQALSPPLTPTRRADRDEDGTTLVGTSGSLCASPTTVGAISKKPRWDEENQNWVE